MGQEDESAPLAHEGWDDIKDMKRGCTDCFCVLLIVLVWVGLTILGFISCGVITSTTLPMGNPNRLLYATDYNGRICGVGSNSANKYAYYLLDKTVVCVNKCPSELSLTTFYCKSEYQSIVDADSTGAIGAFNTYAYNCMFSIPTTETINRCVPNLSSQQLATLSDTYDYNIPTVSTTSGQGWFNTFIADVYDQLGLIFGFGLGVSTALSFVFIYGLRIPGLMTIVIWFLILAVLVFLIVCSFLLWSLGVTYMSDGIHSNYEALTCQIFGYIGMGASFLYFCLILVLCKRISLAIAIVKETSKAIAAMPLIILMPLIQVVGIACFLVVWTIYAIYLAASGTIVEVSATTQSGVAYTYKTLEYTDNSKYAFLYMIFTWFWTSEFIVAIGQISIALAVTSWYFTKDKSSVSSSTVFWAMRVTFFYHMGTAAFGSLVIAIIKTIRAVIAYLQKQAEQQKNKVMEYVLCVCQCCMWCLEKCMKFLNKNAYIITAIYGYSFMKSARVAFFTLLRNILRVSAVSLVSDFVLLLGKLFVPMGTVFILYLIMVYHHHYHYLIISL